nr:MAG TPA: MROUPO protein [Caudoviricetes sp.]
MATSEQLFPQRKQFRPLRPGNGRGRCPAL